jgi:hypothetical protein
MEAWFRVEEIQGGRGEEAAMSLEQRLNYLLNAAVRAERNGDHRLARSLRRMAEDIRPIDRAITLVLSEATAT